jgi:hypothetical protein
MNALAVSGSPARDVYDWLVLGCSLVLTAVGIVGVVVAAITVKKIGRQTKAGEDAAKAALLNAQAVINAERGKLLFEVEKRLDDKFRGVGVFTIVAVNYGRVPTEILGYAPPTETITNSPKELTVPPQYKPEIMPVKRFLAPGEKCLVGEVSPAAPGRRTINAVNLAVSSGISINDQVRIVYGEIRYMDGISNEIRFSRYCFRLDRSQFRVIGGSLVPLIPDGPRDYNNSN